MEDAKPPTKKKTGHDSPFSDAQLLYIDSFFPAFEQLLRKHKLHLGKAGKEHDPAEVSDWINKIVDKILKSGEFKGKLDETLKTPKQWKVCYTIFDNGLYCEGQKQGGLTGTHKDSNYKVLYGSNKKKKNITVRPKLDIAKTNAHF